MMGDFKEKYPLTAVQLGIYAEWYKTPQSDTYNISFSMAFTRADYPGLTAEKLREAVAAVIDAHSALKCTIATDSDGRPAMYPHPERAAEITVHSGTVAEYRAYRERFVRPFDLAKGVYRLEIFATEEGLYLLADFHHIMFDGSSLINFRDELQRVLRGEQPAGEIVSMFDAAEEDAEKRRGEEYNQAKEYYRELLSAAPDMSFIRKDKEGSGPCKGELRKPLGRVSRQKLRQLAKDTGCGESACLLAAFSVLLGRYKYQDEAAFATVYSGRSSKRLSGLMGMLVRTLPVVCHWRSDTPVRELVGELAEQLAGSRKNDAYSFADMSREFGASPEIIFVYQGIMTEDATSGLELLELRDIKNPLSVQVFPTSDSYILDMIYDASLYSGELMAEFAESFELCLESLPEAETAADLRVLSAEQLARLNEFNRTEQDYDKTTTLVDLFERQAADLPDKSAVYYEGKELSFGEVRSMAGKLAGHLTGLGIGRGDFVPVLLARSEWLVPVTLGVLTAGAAFQPLDTTYPAERLQFMIADSGARVIVTQRELAGLLAGFAGTVIYIDEIPAFEPWRAERGALPKPEDACVLVYTSGTTGKPKGIVIGHSQLRAYYEAYSKLMGMDRRSRVAFYASYGFDAGAQDILITMGCGGTLYIIPEEMRLDFAALDAYFIRNEITSAFMTTQVGRMFIEQTKCRSLRRFVVGGEGFVPVAPPEGIIFYNGYGPSETTCSVTAHRVTDTSSVQPIGKAYQNVKLYVAGRDGKRLPCGAAGELWIAGPQVVSGYLNNPEKTAQVFIANPFDDEPGYERVYRTGDIVRLLPSGEVDFIGRDDGQVKIRGFRIELTEVEAAVRSFAGVKDAAVVALDSPRGGKLLAAYVVADGKPDIAALKQHIAASKPPYMVPEFIMQIERIPLTVNQKVDRRALPRPQAAERTEKTAGYGGSLIAEKLREILGRILPEAEAGYTDNLFELGLNSLAVIMLAAEINKAFAVELGAKRLLGGCSLQSLENDIIRILLARSTKPAVPEVTAALKEYYPLTRNQFGVYSAWLREPQSLNYNIPFVLDLGQVDIETAEAALRQTMAVHFALKSTIGGAPDGTICMFPHPEAEVVTERIDLAGRTTEELLREFIRPHNLARRAYRFAFCRYADGLRLFGDIHHVLYDGSSHAIFTADLQQALSGKMPERESVTAFDISEAEEKARKSPDYNSAGAYYAELLSGVEGNTVIPADCHGKDSTAGYVSLALDKLKYDEVEAFVSSIGATQNTFHLSVMGKLLSLFTGQDEVCFTTVYNGRGIPQVERTVGMLVKTLPLVCRPDEQGTTADYVRSVQKQLLASMQHDIYSFSEISQAYDIGIDTMFIYQGLGEASESNDLIKDLKADLQLELSVAGGQYLLNLGYNQSKYSASLMQSLAASYGVLAASLLKAARPAEAVAVPAEQLAVMAAFNRTDYPYDDSTTVVDLFAARVKEQPEQAAVFYEGKVLSYREVDELSGKLAACLGGLGIGAEDFVSVLLNRSEQLVPVTYGILKAGAAYQPLDLSYPVRRLQYMIADCRAKAVVTERALSGILQDYHGRIIYVDEIESLAAPEKAEPVRPRPENAAVILYTSGTTGKPKGVVIEHAQLRAYFEPFRELMHFSSQSRVGFYSSYGFDAGVMDVLNTVAGGGTLYVIPEELRLNLRAMDEYFIRHEITNAAMTTQVGRMFAQMTKCRTLRYVLVGGEMLTPFVPPAELTFYNSYGPSETMCCVTAHRVTDDSPLQLIGPPHKNTKLYVIDKNLNRLPIGAVGELGIAGRQVARGYLYNPEKTAQAFIANPFDAEAGSERLYRTGDMVRLTADGEYQFIGRADSQVKIRGYRIELSEIEEIIRRFPGVRDVTVNVYKEADGSKAIAAYVVSEGPVDETRLAAFIRHEKPAYMVPSAVIRLEKIPLTVNSKVDKRALPLPERKKLKKGAEPADETESAFCDIFREVLGTEKVYADDDFFAIGGSSLSAAQAVMKCDAAGFSIVYKNLFANPTPQKLAGFVRGARTEDITAPAGAEKEKYDYSCLAYNVKDNLAGIKNNGIGDVLLTGVTGYLGSHVYKALMKTTGSRVICPVRSRNGLTADERFQMIMTYYFEDWYGEAEAARTVIVDADLGEEGIAEKLRERQFDVIINTAANVKHFAKGNDLLRDNYESVGQLIALAEARQALLVQASSVSVAGESVNGSVPPDYRFRETDLNIGQSLENKYVYSKYLAEQLIVDAISRGRIRGKIIRLGNLAAREADGEFQINPYNSGLLRYLQGIIRLGCYPVDMMDATIEFSPIDEVAEAIIMLAGTPDGFTVFHARNCHEIHYGYLINALKGRGHKIDIVEKEEFESRYRKALAEDDDVSGYIGFIAYLNRADTTVADDGGGELEKQQAAAAVKERLYETRVKIAPDTVFTTKALYRLGFSWPLTSKEYLDSMILMLDDKAFF